MGLVYRKSWGREYVWYGNDEAVDAARLDLDRQNDLHKVAILKVQGLPAPQDTG